MNTFGKSDSKRKFVVTIPDRKRHLLRRSRESAIFPVALVEVNSVETRPMTGIADRIGSDRRIEKYPRLSGERALDVELPFDGLPGRLVLVLESVRDETVIGRQVGGKEVDGVALGG